MSCSATYEYIQCRVDPQLRARLNRLRNERHLNVSSWLRRVIAEALDREFPPDIPAAPLPGWKPARLPDGSWGSLYEGDAAALPADLVGSLIAVQPSGEDAFTTTVLEVIERSERHVLVRDSGKPTKGAPQ